MLFSLLKHYLDADTALKVSQSVYCFTASISHGVENCFPRLWGMGISDAIFVHLKVAVYKCLCLHIGYYIYMEASDMTQMQNAMAATAQYPPPPRETYNPESPFYQMCQVSANTMLLKFLHRFNAWELLSTLVNYRAKACIIFPDILGITKYNIVFEILFCKFLYLIICSHELIVFFKCVSTEVTV